MSPENFALVSIVYAMATGQHFAAWDETPRTVREQFIDISENWKQSATLRDQARAYLQRRISTLI